MALKGDRNIKLDEVGFFTNSVSERGGIMCIYSAGSGAALDSSQSIVYYAPTSSGKVPIGVALEDIVNIDLTRQSINFNKMEAQVGSKICLAQDGWVVTNMITGNPAAGDPAYLGSSGNFQTTTGGATVNPKVGIFVTKKDEDGYARVSFRFPLTS